MNARGAMEIILGLLALENGLIRQRMFVALVIMALVTSMMSGPAIQFLLLRNRAQRFTAFMSPRLFRNHLHATDRYEAIRELVVTVASEIQLDANVLAKTIIERELTGSTGLGEGIALPHARLACVRRPLVAIGLSPAGVDFDAPDGQPARLICLVLLPESSSAESLAILADIARTFKVEQPIREEALQCQSYTELLAVIRANQETGEARRKTTTSGQSTSQV